MPKKLQATTLENIFVSEGHRALYNEITYLKKRIHLVEGERKANYESNEAVIKKNEGAITKIKETNKTLKQKRKSMVDTRSNYFKKISNMLGGEKKAFEFKDKDAREVLEILENKIGDLKNKLNILDYKRLHYTKDMDGALQAEVTLRKKIFKKQVHSDSRIEELKATETSTAAMQMKTTEAENVRARYKHMLGVLKDENYTQIIKLTDLEKNIEKQQKEIIRIHAVLKDANKARKSAKAHLLYVEEETIQEYSAREQELYEARMKLKIIRDKMESIGSKLSYPKFHIIHRDSSVTDGLFPPMNPLSDMGESKSLSTIEGVYFELQELTGESDPKLLVQRFDKQRHHAKELVKQEQTMKSAVRKAKLRRRFLADKVGQLQFSGGLTREELNEKAGVINEQMNSTTTERDRLDNIINEHTVMMEQLLSKLIEICSNNDLRLTNSTRNDSPIGQKIITLLKHILHKTEQIVQEQTTVTTSTPLLSPLAVRRHTTASTSDVNKDEEERLLGIDTCTKYRFGSTGDISLTGGHDDITTLGSRKPSLTDISMLDTTNPMNNLTVEGLDTINSAVSPLSDSTGFQLQLRIPDDDAREDSEKPKERTNFSTKGQESSEEEEAVTRNFVKRQSQILFEAKTRKGRFNPNAAPTTRHRRY